MNRVSKVEHGNVLYRKQMHVMEEWMAQRSQQGFIQFLWGREDEGRGGVGDTLHQDDEVVRLRGEKNGKNLYCSVLCCLLTINTVTTIVYCKLCSWLENETHELRQYRYKPFNPNRTEFKVREVINGLLFLALPPKAGHGLLSLEVSRSHTQRHTTFGRTPLDE